MALRRASSLFRTQSNSPSSATPQVNVLQRYCAALGSDRAASDVGEVVKAAVQGRVDIWLLAQDRDPERELNSRRRANSYGNEVSQTDELLDYAATQTLNYGGAVYMLKRLPGDSSPVAALLRP